MAGQSPLGYGYESQPSTTSIVSVNELFESVKDYYDIRNQVLSDNGIVDLYNVIVRDYSYLVYVKSPGEFKIGRRFKNEARSNDYVARKLQPSGTNDYCLWYEGRELVNLTYVDPENGFRLRTDEEVAAFIKAQAESKADSGKSDGDNRELRGVEFSKGLTIEDLGRNKDLVAAHNLSGDKLLASISLGDFVMPSIAVTKDTISHDGFGPITLLFDKNTIDPAKNFKT